MSSDEASADSVLPDCNDLFRRFFKPWFSESDFQRRGYETTTRPDVTTLDELQGRPASELCGLNQADQNDVIEQVTKTMANAAISDFGSLLNLSAPFGVNWIEAIDSYYDVARIEELIARSDPADFGNDYVVTCIEIAALIGSLIKARVPEVEWLPAWPYWETSLWHPATGQIIPPTDWGIKKLSSYGWDDGLVPKIEMAIELLTKKPIHSSKVANKKR